LLLLCAMTPSCLPSDGASTKPRGNQGRDFADYQLGALPPLGALVGASVYVDPEVLGHETVAFAAGTQTESVKLRPGELFGGGQVTTVPLVRRPERGSEDPVGRRRAAQQTMADRGQPAS
jgi:Aminoacyl-tRNA editing domain